MAMTVRRTMAGSEGICLDLKTPEGQEIMGKLAARADLLLHSMRPGAPERTGIGYEQLSRINPNLVYLYAGGFGSNGPYSHRPSMAPPTLRASRLRIGECISFSTKTPTCARTDSLPR